MMLRVDTRRGGVHTPWTSVTSVTSVTRPVYAGCRGAKKKTSVTNALQQVLHKPLPKQTAPLKKENLKKEKLGFFIERGYPILMTCGVRQPQGAHAEPLRFVPAMRAPSVSLIY
jgi:hypothetical protein